MEHPGEREIEKTDVETLLKQADHHKNKRLLYEAVGLYEHVAEITKSDDENHSRALGGVGLCNLDLFLYIKEELLLEESIQKLEEAITGLPTNVEFRNALSKAYRMNSDYFNAALELVSSIEIDPETKVIKELDQLIERIYDDSREDSEAIARAMRKSRDDYLKQEGHLLLCDVQLYRYQHETFDEEKLKSALNEAILGFEVRRNHPDLCYKIGVCKEHMGEMEEAIEAYEEAISLDPELVACAADLAKAYLQCHERENAIQTLEESLDYNPGNAELTVSLAKIYIEEDRLLDAEEIVLSAFQHEDKSDREKLELYLTFSKIRSTQDRHDEAYNAIKKVLEYDPDNIDAQLEHAIYGADIDLEGSHFAYSRIFNSGLSSLTDEQCRRLRFLESKLNSRGINTGTDPIKDLMRSSGGSIRVEDREPEIKDMTREANKDRKWE